MYQPLYNSGCRYEFVTLDIALAAARAPAASILSYPLCPSPLSPHLKRNVLPLCPEVP